jgi:hypothetical protein
MSEPTAPSLPFPLRPLPARVAPLVLDLGAPPRLVAHLVLVHDVAAVIADALAERWPALRFDRDLVLIGAATHDVGKAIHPDELTGPGTRHEEAGEALLLQRGFAPDEARFARTHGQGASADLPLEDLVVILADVAWQGARWPDVEDCLCAIIAAASGQPLWEVFASVDDILTEVGADANERLAWEARHPASSD